MNYLRLEQINASLLDEFEVHTSLVCQFIKTIIKQGVDSSNGPKRRWWFQQDDATCHTARAIIDLLKDTFCDRLISRFGPVNWPPRSCDLTPLDYFLWGYVKSLVYEDKPQTLEHLEDNIRRVIADIRPQMLEKVIENWTSRLDYIRASRGKKMPWQMRYQVAMKNNSLKRWNTTENDVSKNQFSAYFAIRLPNTSILNLNVADIT
ncbi:transposable element Tc3 transposase [Trichonephila clavipes]|nr:transposable element Tc3 transposase [Trichonephila clavipes]